VKGLGGTPTGIGLIEIFEVDTDRPATIAPAIVSQPANVTTVTNGAATFSVVALGKPAATYQWRKDGATITGATAATYTRANVTRSADAGSYDVVVTGAGGATVTSTAATLTVLPAEISGLTPQTAQAGSSAFTLTVNGQGFVSGSTVMWNGSPRTTTVVSGTSLTATINAADVTGGMEISTAVVTVRSPELEVSNGKSFSILAANVAATESSVSTVGTPVTVTTAPTSTSSGAGVTAVLENSGSTTAPPATISVANYTANASSVSYFNAGGGYVDVQVTGADTSDKATSYFYYPSTLVGAMEGDVALLHFNGLDWRPVLSSGGVAPTKNTTDNLDGTVSGGRFSVVFDNTSTPKITELSGTVITTSLKDTEAPVVTSVTASPNNLGSPNHKMVPVTISVTATDNLDRNLRSRIVSVTCNEAVNAPGSGNTNPDWRITGNLTLELRAERAGTGNDRIYTITVETRDAAGNFTTRTTSVIVPKNGR
jgi:hypothetical protein